MEPYLAQIIMFGGNFAPRGWAFCNGQLLAISQYSAVFSLIGTYYGGDGRTTFGLPDLRGRAPISSGTGPGLTPHQIGSRGGTETNTLTIANLPTHNHAVALQAETAAGTTANPSNALLAISTNQDRIYSPPDPADQIPMHPDSIAQQNVGGGQQVNNMMPYQVVNYIICLQGIFPSRS